MTSSLPSTSSDAALRPVTRFTVEPPHRCPSADRRRTPPHTPSAELTVLRLTHALMLHSERHLARVAELLSIGYAAVVRSMADERRHHAERLAIALGQRRARPRDTPRADNPRTPDRWRRIYVAAVDHDEPRILGLVCDIELDLLAELRVLANTTGLSPEIADSLAPLVETLATDCYLLDHLAAVART